MGCPWDARGIHMDYPWDAHVRLMCCPWDICGLPSGMPMGFR